MIFLIIRTDRDILTVCNQIFPPAFLYMQRKISYSGSTRLSIPLPSPSCRKSEATGRIDLQKINPDHDRHGEDASESGYQIDGSCIFCISAVNLGELGDHCRSGGDGSQEDDKEEIVAGFNNSKSHQPL